MSMPMVLINNSCQNSSFHHHSIHLHFFRPKITCFHVSISLTLQSKCPRVVLISFPVIMHVFQRYTLSKRFSFCPFDRLFSFLIRHLERQLPFNLQIFFFFLSPSFFWPDVWASSLTRYIAVFFRPSLLRVFALMAEHN